MKLNFLTFILLLTGAFNASANDGLRRGTMVITPSPSPPQTKPLTNKCIEAFKAHGKQASQIQETYSICKKNSWSSRDINRVKWSTYFSCFDKFISHKATFPHFHSECLKKPTWLLSAKFNRCHSKVDNLQVTSPIQTCSIKSYAISILSKDFDSCTSDIQDLRVSQNRSVQVCSSHAGQSKVSCYSKLKAHISPTKAWQECSSNYNIRNAVLNSNLDSCMIKMKKLGANSANSLSVCSSYQSTELVKCISTNSSYFDVNTLANKCNNYSFRESSKNPDFNKCITKVQNDNISKLEAISMCSVSDSELKLIVHSRDFNQCLKKDFRIEIPTRDRYSICSDSKTSKLIGDYSYQKCLQSGFNSGIQDYFKLRSEESSNYSSPYVTNTYSNTDIITPWSYVFKDCIGDYKYRNKSKQFNPYLKVYKDYNIHTNALFKDQNLKVGGLSAVRFDEKSNKVYFLSDDRGFNTNSPPRIYTYDYLFNKSGELELTESHIISLTKKNKANNDESGKNNYFTQMDMDPEGFDFTRSGDIIISSELDDLVANDFLSIFSPDGKAFETIPLNDDFKPLKTAQKKCYEKKRKTNFSYNSNWGTIRGSNSNTTVSNEANQIHDDTQSDTYEVCKTTYTQKGFLPNKSLESLSLTPDKNYMFTANESSLYQDTNESYRSNRGKRVRIVRYKADLSDKFKEEKQFFYRLENNTENGLVEILALNRDSILTLERSWDSSTKKVTSRIFLVNLTKAQNILDADEDLISKVRSVKKKLILDLDEIKYELSPGFRKIDNIEGMSFGPTLPNGERSLVLVSDNNFRLSQRSMIIIFELNLYKLLKLTR